MSWRQSGQWRREEGLQARLSPTWIDPHLTEASKLITNFLIFKMTENPKLLGGVAYVCKPSTQEAEAGGWVQV